MKLLKKKMLILSLICLMCLPVLASTVNAAYLVDYGNKRSYSGGKGHAFSWSDGSADYAYTDWKLIHDPSGYYYAKDYGVTYSKGYIQTNTKSWWLTSDYSFYFSYHEANSNGAGYRLKY